MAFVHKIRQVQLIGPKIRKMRKERKLTQTELASRIGIQQSDLSRMEKGEYRVSLDTLFKILGEFDVSISEFFEDRSQSQMTPRDARLLRDLQNLAPGARKEVEAFIAFKQTQGAAEDGIEVDDEIDEAPVAQFRPNSARNA
ncbi:MAG: helix-turn-helix transcriptional regulator [Acidobacteriota bacterium]